MRFGPTPLDEAKGAILAHTTRLRGRVIRKGSVLDEEAVALLRDSGRREVIAARLEPGDVPEDICADRLADPFAAPGLARTRAATGRANLTAEAAGVLRVDAAKIDRINAVDESLTVGTLPDYTVVAPRDMVATIKVIPFAVPAAVLDVAVTIAEQGPPAMTLFPFRPLKVGLVATQLPGIKESVTEKTIAVTQGRVAALTGSLLPPRRTPHETGAIANALLGLIAEGADLLLVVGASAVVDRRDVGPAGIEQAGGTIVHFGMPVDPGNLICLGRIGDRPALVLPGCARSPALNGIDFVLARLFAGLPVGAREVSRMGVGGLLKEMDTRPMPRADAPAVPRTGPAPRRAPTIAAVVLAAGRSSRMAPYNKLLIEDRTGKPMIARVVDNVLASRARPILVVTGHMASEVEEALRGKPVRFVHAPDYVDGLSASLKAGIAAVPVDTAAAVVCLGDMPLITGRVIDRLLGAYDADEGRLIVQPTHQGRPGNPMLWDRRFFPEILALAGDAGARALIKRHMENVADVPVDDDAVLRDFDTTESLATLPSRLRPVGFEPAGG